MEEAARSVRTSLSGGCSCRVAVDGVLCVAAASGRLWYGCVASFAPATNAALRVAAVLVAAVVPLACAVSACAIAPILTRRCRCCLCRAACT